MKILAIETSGKTASCCILQGSTVLGQKTVFTNLTHSQVILPFVKEILHNTETNLESVDLIAVSAGPGSYTGLRIGIAIAKGLAFGGKKCLGISTLEALAQGAVGCKGFVVPVMQARPGVVYFGIYMANGQDLTAVLQDRVAEISELEKAVNSLNGEVILVGDGAEAAKSGIFPQNENVGLCPPQLRLQQASGVAFAALRHIDEATEAEALSARYLQITKAEKDLQK